MSVSYGGVFVSLDGPGGVGKTTTAADLTHYLTARGYTVHATTEPSHHTLGQIARQQSDSYSGYALACLVAADRYHHLDTEIRPHLAAGHIVICDRYVASSYVLQRMDHVPLSFIESLNAATDIPDLAIFLTGDPDINAQRLRARGTHSRFETETSSHTEAVLYRDTLERLAARGYPLLTVNTSSMSSVQVTALIADRLAQLASLPEPGNDTA